MWRTRLRGLKAEASDGMWIRFGVCRDGGFV